MGSSEPWFVTDSDPGDEHKDFASLFPEPKPGMCRHGNPEHLCQDVYCIRFWCEKSVLHTADYLVEGHRQKDYGHPSVDLGRTAKLWTALMDFEFTACDVAQMMRMVKESRLRNSPRHRDSLVDIAGYARTQEMIWEREDASASCEA